MELEALQTPVETAAELKARILEGRKKHIGYNCALNYSKDPLMIVRGEGQWLYDETGKAYLDCVNNVCHVGHCHPAVANAAATQLMTLNTNSRYLHPNIVNYSKRLAATMPEPLSVVYWCNSGSEANDLALRLARAHTGRRGVVTVGSAYHGHLTNIIDISPYKYQRTGGKGRRGWVREAPSPDVYSGLHRGALDDESLGAAYAGEVQKLLDEFRGDEEAERSFVASRAVRLASESPQSSSGPAAAATPLRQRLLKSDRCPSCSSSPNNGDPNESCCSANCGVDGCGGSGSGAASVASGGCPISSPGVRSVASSVGSASEAGAADALLVTAIPQSSVALDAQRHRCTSASQTGPSLEEGRPIAMSSSSASQSSAAEVQQFVDANVSDDGLTAGCGAFIMESILSCGGQVVPPAGYLRRVYQAVRSQGGVCIADEVQVGFGRVGSHMWAFQMQGEDVVPDIVTLGKPMGNGFPVAAVVTTPSIARSFANGMEYFNTFGGNPVAGAVALATLDVLQSSKLQEHASRVGAVLLDGFEAMYRKYDGMASTDEVDGGAAQDSGRVAVPGCPCIGSVRGVGLMVGLEFVDNRCDRNPDGDTAVAIKYACLKEDAMLLSTDGMSDQVIKLKPPMVFTEANARDVMASMDRVMDRLRTEAIRQFRCARPQSVQL